MVTKLKRQMKQFIEIHLIERNMIIYRSEPVSITEVTIKRKSAKQSCDLDSQLRG